MTQEQLTEIHEITRLPNESSVKFQAIHDRTNFLKRAGHFDPHTFLTTMGGKTFKGKLGSSTKLELKENGHQEIEFSTVETFPGKINVKVKNITSPLCATHSGFIATAPTSPEELYSILERLNNENGVKFYVRAQDLAQYEHQYVNLKIQAKLNQ